MIDCSAFSLNPFANRPWPYALFMTVMMLGLVAFMIWFTLDNRRYRREMAIRDAIRDERWAAEDPDGYALAIGYTLAMQRRAETEALVAARMAAYQPWWRRRRA
jgi:hypothetical protein